MKLISASYKCGHCGRVFEAPTLGEYAYGEFLLWSKSGEMVYLNVFEDESYDEVAALLKSHHLASKLSDLERADLLIKIYGALACDKDSRGFPFSIELPPPCPACGHQGVASWNASSPACIIDINLRVAEHVFWSELTNHQKIKMLDLELSKLLTNK